MTEQPGQRPTVQQVLGQLEQEGLLEPGADERARAALRAGQPGGEALPWYVRVLMGAGAWVSTLCALGFLSLTGLISGRPAMAVMGLLCAGGGLALRRSSSADFLVQLSLSLSMAGRAMLYASLADENTTLAALAVLAGELLTVVFFPDVVGRFVATLGAWSALLVLLYQTAAPGVLLDAAAAGGLGALTALAWVLQPALLRRGLVEQHAPVAYGLAVALLAQRFSWWHLGGHTPWAAGLALLAVGVATGEAILRELRVTDPRPRALVAATIALLGLLTLGSPGIAAALLVMALGVHRRAPLLGGLAAAFLLIFGVKFYYDLDIGLLAKSGLLLGCGLLLLGARALVERRRTA